jgi:hypothetical protein
MRETNLQSLKCGTARLTHAFAHNKMLRLTELSSLHERLVANVAHELFESRVRRGHVCLHDALLREGLVTAGVVAGEPFPIGLCGGVRGALVHPQSGRAREAVTAHVAFERTVAVVDAHMPGQGTTVRKSFATLQKSTEETTDTKGKG